MKIQTFQNFITSLCEYWTNLGCIWSQPYDAQMGAGTFHPHTFLKALGPEPWRSVYVQPCRRPVDGRYGKSPYRFQHYYQLQVLLKPSPSNIVDLFLKSLQHVGINLKENDICLLEDDWKGPTLGAWGLGWEVRANGQEVTQFTYFQQIGGIDCDVICGEITYGLERLFMYAHGYKNALDMPYNEHFTYGDIFYQNEYEFSFYNFKEADVKTLFEQFDLCELKANELCEKDLILPAYDYVLKASHAFNLLDARGAISVSERQRFIARVRDCAKKCALTFKESRQKSGYPLISKIDKDPRKPIIVSGTYTEDVDVRSNLKFYDKNAVNNDKKLNILFELGVEELPSTFQTNIVDEFKQKFSEFLSKIDLRNKLDKDFCKQLADMKLNLNVSSRRIVIEISDVPVFEPERKIEVWGPAERIAKNKDGTLSQAGQGFCRKNNLSESEVSFKEKEGSLFLFALKTDEKVDFPNIIFNEIKKILTENNLTPKMKWLPEDISPSFIRPVRWVLCMVDDKVFDIDMFGLKSSNITYGQRILTPEPVNLKHVCEYSNVLKSLGVVFSCDERKNIIKKASEDLLSSLDARITSDASLFEKCSNISESPKPFMGSFPEKYLRLPERLITSVLRDHMNYFSVLSNKTEKLCPHYIGVASYECGNLDKMIQATQEVVIGRLEDGAFYFDTDLSTNFLDLRNSLKNQVFQEGMGTLFDKTKRLEDFARNIFSHLEKRNIDLFNESEKRSVVFAAQNCKNDLKTGCVQEFPDDMQGVMGGILVRHAKPLSNDLENNMAADAISQHYSPINSLDGLPKSKIGCFVSFLDKFDSLCMMLVHGLEIKGSKDIFGLRRLGIACSRLLGIKDEQYSKIFEQISVIELLSLWKSTMADPSVFTKEKENKVCDFISERIRSLFKEEFDARSVELVSKNFLTYPVAHCREFIKTIDQSFKSEFSNVLLSALVPYKRARMLSQNVQLKQINGDLFQNEFETNLYSRLLQVEDRAQKYFESGHFQEFLSEMSSLSEPLALFFDNVMVNDKNDEIRENRLQLLSRIKNIYEKIADFSTIQVN